MDWVVGEVPDRLCCSCGATELAHQSFPCMQRMREAQKKLQEQCQGGNHSVTPAGWETVIGKNHTQGGSWEQSVKSCVAGRGWAGIVDLSCAPSSVLHSFSKQLLLVVVAEGKSQRNTSLACSRGSGNTEHSRAVR